MQGKERGSGWEPCPRENPLLSSQGALSGDLRRSRRRLVRWIPPLVLCCLIFYIPASPLALKSCLSKFPRVLWVTGKEFPVFSGDGI